MNRIAGGGRLSVAHPQFYPKDETCLDLPGLLSIIATRPRQKFLIQVDLDTAFCMCDYRMADIPIVYTSTSFEKLTGYSEAESLGRNCRFLQGKDTDKSVVKQIGESIRCGTEETFELVNYRKDGTKFTNYLTMLPIFDNEQSMNPIYSLGVQSDVPFPRAGCKLDLSSFAEAKPGRPVVTKIQRAMSTSTGPDEALSGSEATDDARSMYSGFTGFVEDSSPGSSIKLFRPAVSVSGEEDGIDGKRGTCLDEEETEGDTIYPAISPTSTVSKKDSGFEASSVPKARLESIHRQLSSLDVCKKYLAKTSNTSKRTTGMKGQVRLMLAYLGSIVEGTDGD